MDGLKNGMESNMDGLESKLKRKIEYLNKDMEGLKGFLAKLLQ